MKNKIFGTEFDSKSIMKSMSLYFVFTLITFTAVSQDVLDTFKIQGCWEMKETITSSGEYERYGTYTIRVDTMNIVWQQTPNAEIRKSGLAINGSSAFFSWPYREKFRIVNQTDTTFTLIRYINDTIPIEEYEQMPYPRGPQSTSVTIRYDFTRRDCTQKE